MQFYFLMFTGKEQITPLAGGSPRTGEKGAFYGIFYIYNETFMQSNTRIIYIQVH